MIGVWLPRLGAVGRFMVQNTRHSMMTRLWSRSSLKAFAGYLLFGSARGWQLCLFPASLKRSDVMTSSDSCSSALEQADQFYDGQQYEKTVELLTPLKDGDNVEVLWRWVRVQYELSKLIAGDTDKLNHLQLHFSAVQRALELDPAHPNCHKWMAIYLNAISKLQGAKSQIERSETIKTHMLKACELGADDPTNWHLLGMWCFSVADISWTMRKLAQMVYGTPPTATFQQALDHFLRAEQARAGSYSMNYLMIGKCYQKLKDNDNAIKYYQLVINYDVKTTDDKQAHKEATGLLSSLGVKV